jgi:hypothetical protein
MVATLIKFLLTTFSWLVVASMLLIIGVGIAGVVFLAVVG